MKKILFSLVVICSICLLAGCGGVNKDMIGTYKGIEMKEGKTTYNEETLDKLGVAFTLEVKKDGKAVLNLAGEKTELTYNSKYFKNDDGRSEYKFKNNKIIMTSDDTSMTFRKVK